MICTVLILLGTSVTPTFDADSTVTFFSLLSTFSAFLTKEALVTGTLFSVETTASPFTPSVNLMAATSAFWRTPNGE